MVIRILRQVVQALKMPMAPIPVLMAMGTMVQEQPGMKAMTTQQAKAMVMEPRPVKAPVPW